MEAPAITRRHRPFLAPIWLSALLLVVAAAVVFTLYRSATTTTVVIVRQGETARGSVADPPLDAEGERSTQRLAQLFSRGDAPARITAIYAQATRSAQQTAAPLAALLGLQVSVVQDPDADALAGRALSERRGQTVMIVTSASVMPQLVEALSSVRPPLAADDYGTIFVVSVPMIGSSGLLELRY